ncbi:hypothetical protein F5884DRAFT_860412 [Xylogone sp. PMI_703]|nr:hypothetical protein F5884DRAFT_860412 [Xylogone sp. PMI_703]
MRQASSPQGTKASTVISNWLSGNAFCSFFVFCVLKRKVNAGCDDSTRTSQPSHLQQPSHTGSFNIYAASDQQCGLSLSLFHGVAVSSIIGISRLASTSGMGIIGESQSAGDRWSPKSPTRATPHPRHQGSSSGGAGGVARISAISNGVNTSINIAIAIERTV